MSYRIAGIDVHKKMLAVVVADIEVEGEYEFERRRYGSSPEHLRLLCEWLIEQQVEEVVMESTAQYWRPVWEVLERDWQPRRRTREGAGPLSGALHLAQAQSNRGASGRKKDPARPPRKNTGRNTSVTISVAYTTLLRTSSDAASTTSNADRG